MRSSRAGITLYPLGAGHKCYRRSDRLFELDHLSGAQLIAHAQLIQIGSRSDGSAPARPDHPKSAGVRLLPTAPSTLGAQAVPRDCRLLRPQSRHRQAPIRVGRHGPAPVWKECSPEAPSSAYTCGDQRVQPTTRSTSPSPSTSPKAPVPSVNPKPIPGPRVKTYGRGAINGSPLKAAI